MALPQTLIKVAQKLLKQFGRDITLKTITYGDYNPDSGDTETVTSTTIRAFTDVYKTNQLKDGLINAGDLALYTTSAITKDDKVNFDSTDWQITMVQKYFCNATTVLYIGNIRRL